ncbi:beta/gamma crystallin family protein [Pendulispora brunnea]|uniref:Beta/gamma crystallin family protein n=1 Tax=Pendulispora brunnea TaxID=2905690 RepID=A0ABZ2K2A5_9BACT
MKITLSNILCLFLAAFSLMACTIHLDDEDRTVTVYTDPSFRGQREQRTEREGKCANVPDSVNDRVESIACNGDITVYEHEDCRGASRRFTCDIPNLNDFGWADRISSIRF